MANPALILKNISHSSQLHSILEAKIQENCEKDVASQEKSDIGQTEYKIFKATDLISIAIEVLSLQPNLFDEVALKTLIDYFKGCQTLAQGLITIEIVTKLHSSKSQTLTWIKYENLLRSFIKEHIYKPKTMVNELLELSKNELDPTLASRFSSVINGCVKYCRESQNHNAEGEEEEKWSEIVEWMSWFLGGELSDL